VHAIDANASTGSPFETAVGLLGVWHGVEPGFERNFDEWYDREHHRERVGIDGFLRARRYVNLGRGPRFFCRYEVTDAGVLASAAYLHRVDNPTEWTRSLLPRYRDTTRAVFRSVARVGDAEGGSLVTLRVSDTTVADAEGWLDRALAALQPLCSDAGVLRVELWHADIAASGLRSEEKRLRPDADAVPAYAVLVEGSDVDRASDAVSARLLPLVARDAVVDRYRLAFALERR
jgi:hypothetical protein